MNRARIRIEFQLANEGMQGMCRRGADLRGLRLVARKLEDVHETVQKALKKGTIMYRVRPVFHAVTRWVRGYNRGTPGFQYLLPKLDLLTYKTFPLLVRLCFRKALVSSIHSLRKTASLQTCYVISDTLPTSSDAA